MVAIYKHQDKTKLIQWSRFSKPNKNEEELRDIIAENPSILNNNLDDLPLATVMTEFILDDDRIDVFLIDAKGLPVIVETKLADNPECEGIVIEQIVRYASKISLMSFEEINKRSSGKLEESFKSLNKNENEYRAAKLFFENRVRYGPIRLIIALDSAPNSLIREWLFENAHSRNDIELIAIRKYSLNGDEVLVVPYHIISYNAKRILNPKGARQVFLEIIDEFRRLNLPGTSLGNPMATNCAVFITGHRGSPAWPKKVHYEFTDWNIDENRIGIEVMAELKKFSKMKEPILSLEDKIREKFPDQKVTILQDEKKRKGDYKGWTRLQISCNGDLPPKEIASTMVILIQETREILALYLDNPENSQ